MDYNTCSVPHCVVTRNSLSKWRLIAQELYKFPKSLSLTLHICPEDERGQWIAELDLDPMMNGKICVCSLHFKDGYPSQANPFPTVMLRDGGNKLKKEDVVFEGAKDEVREY